MSNIKNPLNTNFGDQFPQRNLGESAESWGRAMETRIKQLEKVARGLDSSLTNTKRASSSIADSLVLRDKAIKEQTENVSVRAREIQEELTVARIRLSEVGEELDDMTIELDQKLDDLEDELEQATIDLTELKEVTLPAVEAEAEAARDDAVEAKQQATQALADVVAKNSVTRSHNTPSGAGKSVGDVWWQYNDSSLTGPIIGQWSWNGSSWVSSPIGNEILESVTVDKLVVTGGAKIPAAVINTLVSDDAFLTNLYTNRVIVDAQDFTPGPGGYEESYSLRRASFVSNSNDRSGVAIRFDGGTASDGQVRGPMLPARAGEEFYLEARYSWYGSSDTGGSTQLRMEWFGDPDEPRIGQSTAVTQQSGTSGADISGTVTAPEGTRYARWYAYNANQSGPGDAALYNLVCRPQVGPVLIQDGAITAPKITASQELSAKVGQFLEVKTDQLTVTGSAGVSELVAQEIWAEKIAAKKVMANEVLIGGSSNLIDFNPEDGVGLVRTFNGTTVDTFESGVVGWTVRLRGGTQSDGGTRYAALRFETDRNDGGPVPHAFKVDPGDSYQLKMNFRRFGSLPPDAEDVRLALLPYDKDGESLGYSYSAIEKVTTTSSRELLFLFEVPAEARYLSPYVFKNFWSSGDLQIFGMSLSRAVDHNLIVDGSILARHLTAESVTAEKISALAITAPKIAANAITTEKLSADAITAKHTITGATLRTAASGARTQITGSGLQVFNSSNQELVRVGHGIETGMSIRNPSDNTLTPLAPLVFGSSYIDLDNNVSFGTGGEGSWSNWHFSGPGDAISSPTGKIMAILVVRMGEGGQGEVEAFPALTTSTSAGGHNISPGDLGGSYYSGSSNRAKAIIASTVGDFHSATMVVINVPRNTTLYPRVRTRAKKHTSTNVVVGRRTLYMIPV